MTKVLSIGDVQKKLPGLLALAKDGDEIIIEENGEPLATVSPIQKAVNPTERIFGLGKGKVWTSEDLDEELPDSFWLGDEE